MLESTAIAARKASAASAGDPAASRSIARWQNSSEEVVVVWVTAFFRIRQALVGGES